VIRALPFKKRGPGFALPIFHHPALTTLGAVQEIDEQSDIVRGFRPLEGDLEEAFQLKDGWFSIIGCPQLYVFVNEYGDVHIGTLPNITGELNDFCRRCPDDIPIVLQIAELIGRTDEKRVARKQMKAIIAQQSGAAAAHSFYFGSVLRKVLWDELIAKATDANAVARILAARSHIGYPC
jgi:hypothetical protein